MSPSLSYFSPIATPDSCEIQPPIKFAPWVEKQHQHFFQAYQAATDSQKNTVILCQLDPADAKYIHVRQRERETDLLSAFLKYSNSEVRYRTLEALLPHTYTSPLKAPITIQTEDKELTLDTSNALALLVYLQGSLIGTPDALQEKSMSIRQKQKKAVYALNDLFNELGPGMADELTGMKLLPTAVNILTIPGNLKKSDKPRTGSLLKPALEKLNNLVQKRLIDLLTKILERLVFIRECREDKLYLSNGNKPSLSLFRTRSVTYALLNIMDKQALTDTPGVYSLIAYLVSLSMGVKPNSQEMLTVKSVKERVHHAIKLWEEKRRTTSQKI